MLPCSSSRDFLSFPLVHTFNMLTLKLSGILLLLILCQHGLPSAGLEAFVICEGESWTLRCSQGSIRVVDATYGRSNSKTCSEGLPPSSTSNTNCRAPVTHIVSFRCDGQTSCVVPASNSLFPDPCPGTHKYLVATYECETRSASQNHLVN
ncbi:D-galactoside-specific lectin-like [Megalobrama amblycephala]|uniref:D-galactoside-specific lectin-like n=1 Tax=Megalobrama amblycephala TaxID=75352 RepID=UPI002013CBC3|nr:D-galactoside-specific lectin-like [Megalobrama amblycephala]XP_048050478.1 D-galactoside-specific lectin-like [Megalobrama amblycephala]